MGGKSSADYLSDAQEIAKTKAQLKKMKVLSAGNERKLNKAIDRKVAQSIKMTTRRVKKGGAGKKLTPLR